MIVGSFWFSRAAVFLMVGLSLVRCSSPADDGAGGGSGGDDQSEAGKGGAAAGGAKGGAGGRGGTLGGAGGALGSGSGGNVGGGVGGGPGGQGGAPPADAAAGGSGGSDAATTGSGGSDGGATLPKFSFFVTSLEAMLKLAKKQDPAATQGFGGDLRYGEKDGLSGADKICSEIAESSMPGSSAKQWRAFLSVVKGPNGSPVHAADRIGQGPWYDRLGRIVAMNKADLLNERPIGAHPAIKEDLPNETGTPNHRPDPTKPVADNHHTLTGSDGKGMLAGPTRTCMDWTTNLKDNQMTGRPRTGYSWSIANRRHWIAGQDEGGCGPGVRVGPNGPADPSMPIVGSGGGYGGFYCFALTP